MDLLSRIGIFIEVAKQESFTKAAEKLGITSSAISKQVQNLEEALQIKLLNRTTRKVSLTEEGLRFYERTSRAINDIREVTEELNELKTTPHGPLKISIPTALGNRFLKTPIAEFAKQYPRVTMDIRFENRKINIIEEEYDLIRCAVGFLPGREKTDQRPGLLLCQSAIPGRTWQAENTAVSDRPQCDDLCR